MLHQYFPPLFWQTVHLTWNETSSCFGSLCIWGGELWAGLHHEYHQLRQHCSHGDVPRLNRSSLSYHKKKCTWLHSSFTRCSQHILIFIILYKRKLKSFFFVNGNLYCILRGPFLLNRDNDQFATWLLSQFTFHSVFFLVTLYISFSVWKLQPDQDTKDNYFPH